ncbi:MAG TPA: 4-hydroxy-tetrahydrodipicolinate synthase [Desulfohalobiaceae bacterium]|nr:4-hydroxy-tetrahydrodipicolinate synthase [Desulfohalobiaceae bacterium]
MQFVGAYTALVTPFKDNQIDEPTFRKHIEWQIEQGIHGLVPCGTTGESATLSHEEHKQAIRICVDQVKGRVPILAGAGSNNTQEAIELTKFAKEANTEGVLLITPYYNKPTQSGLIAHFRAIAKEVSIPFVVYNVPGRTGVNLLPETLALMKDEIKEVVGVKEASGNIKQISEIIEYCGQDFTVLAGEDFIVLPLLGLGGKGAISVVSNIAPKKMSDLCSAHADQDREKTLSLHYDLAPLCRAMFFETNPIPVKTALAMMGKMDLELRLPLVPMLPENETKLRDVLKKSQLI